MENRIVTNVLEANTHFLSRHLILSPTVLEKLGENGVITESIKRQLAFKDTDEQVPFLVRNIRDRGLLTFKRFLAVLRETGHGWMVDKLLSSQALSYEELASAQGGRRLPQESDPLNERSRLHGMTPEHARIRLTSASLRGRGVAEPAYDSTGPWEGRYGKTEYDRQGLGLDPDNYALARRPDVGVRDVGLGFRDTGLGLRDNGLGGLGADRPGLRDRLGGGNYGDIGNRGGYHYPPPQREMGLTSFMENRTRLNGGGSAKYRGQVLPAGVLGNQLRGGIPHDVGSGAGDITDALVNLHGHFTTQTDSNEQNLTILKREEVAIKELLEQNAREQIKVRRNQNALSDISRRLEEVNARAHDVRDPIMNAHLSRYRLAQLNQIPWSSDRLS